MEVEGSTAGRFKISITSRRYSMRYSYPLSALKTEAAQLHPMPSRYSFTAETIIRCRNPSTGGFSPPCPCPCPCSRSANLARRCFLIQSLSPVSLRIPARVCLALSSSIILSLYVMMGQKWWAFALTFLSYSLIHSVRTAWSSLKYSLNSAPYAFEPLFLGTLDMVVLIILAVSLNLFGPMIEKLGAKAFLQRGLLFLAGVMALIGLLLLGQVSSKMPYSILYSLVGVGSCVGWPACIFILSRHFQKGLAFSLWTGSSQFGDFIALMVSYLLVEEGHFNPGFFLLVISLMLVGIYYLNKKMLPEDSEVEVVPPESPIENVAGALVEQDQPPFSSENMQSSKSLPTQRSINFITVWTLPSVPGYILSFLFVKSVNAVVVTWLIFYLSMIGMKRESRIIAVLWAVSTFFGGLLGSYFNPTFNKTIFIASLLASAILFVFLEEVHLYPSETSVIILILTCGLIFGGPFTLMTSSIPLLLSEKPEIRNIPGAKAAIVSAMQGYGLLFCGISLLIVPTVGVIDLHWVASLYCTISATILLYEHLRELNKQLKDQGTLRHRTEAQIEPPQDGEMNMSAPVTTGTRPQKTRRRSRKNNQQQQLSMPNMPEPPADNNAITAKEQAKGQAPQTARQPPTDPEEQPSLNDAQ